MNAQQMIQALRERFTETDLATKLGCDRSTVNRWLNGRNVPAGHTVLRLADLYRSVVNGGKQ